MMKKLLFILMMISFSLWGLGQTDVLLNGNFESWDDANNPTSWTHVENVDQESGAGLVHGGTYSAKHTGGTKDLGQIIPGIIAGETYILTIWYKVIENDGTDARIWSYWRDDEGTLPDNADELRGPDNGYLGNNGGEWSTYTVSVVAPLEATEFYFEVRTYSGAIVYWDDFSFIHDTGIDPEPTNYPTDFSASSETINVIVDWTDATGDQLPDGYLILGNDDGSDFTPPVDSIPVTEDLNWDDGMVAVNVLYGVEAYSFLVDPNTEYNFTIYPYTNTGENINYKTDETAPTASAMSNNLTIANLEGFDSDLGSWTGYNVSGDQVWGWASYGLPPGCAIMNGYDEGPNPNEDWLISPSLDLSNYSEVLFSFDHVRNYGTNAGLSVLVSTDYDGTSDPSSNGTWNDLTAMFTFTEEGTWDWSSAGEADVTMYNGASTYFAFKYISTTEDCSTWEVDNALIYGVLGVGFDEIDDEQINIYPNPAIDMVHITCTNQGNIRIINLAGQVVLQVNTEKGTNRVNIEELNPGLYMVQYINELGNTNTQKLLIR